MRYIIKALNTNNRDLKTALLFSIQERNYLFSCPDGFQRVANLQKMKFGKVKFVFVPSLNPNHFGGLPGFFLSAREAMSANATSEKDFKMILIGPEHVKETLNVAHSFMGDYESHLDVYGVPVCLDKMPDSDMEETKEEVKEMHDHKGNPINGVLKSFKTEHDIFEFMPDTQRLAYQDEFVTIYPVRAVNSDGADPCYSFIGVPAMANAKFIPQAAKALGCDPKKHFSQLANGISVTLADGSVVTPDQVQEPKLPSQAFVLVFLPSADYIDSFIGSNQDLFQHFQAGQSGEKFATGVVYHSVPKTCIENPTYRKEFMNKFGANVTHLLDCPETNKEEYARAKAFALSDMIKQICPLLLPVTQQDFEDYNRPNRLEIEKILQQESEMLKFAHAQLGMSFELYPAKTAGLDLKQIIGMTEEQMLNDQKSKAEIRMVADGLKQMLFDEETKAHIQAASLSDPLTETVEPQVLFLGTSSMKPTSYRGASAIYVFHNKSGILMDCAEGSYGQLWDHFGCKERVDQVLMQTRAIFITHIHGDHQLGVLKIMQERDNLMNEDSSEKFYIVTPTPMLEWMTTFRDQLKNRPDLFVLVPSTTLNPEEFYYYQKFDFDSYKDIKADHSKPSRDICPEKSYEDVQAILEKFAPQSDEGKEMWAMLKKTMDIDRMIAVEVDHCPQSYACMIEGGWGKILYSGDTLPCQNLINYGQKATLLIHEATLQDGMEEDAAMKKHTTTGQAIEIGQKCGAWRTILTHFSPRYQKIAETTQKHLEHKVMIAFDHTRLSLSHFEWAYKMILVYQKLLTNEDPEDNTEKKQDNKQPKVKPQKQKRTKSPKK